MNYAQEQLEYLEWKKSQSRQEKQTSSMMSQEKIRETISQLVKGNLAYADPSSKICLDQHELHPRKFPLGSTFQSAEEVLDDIICDLKALQDELRIEASFRSAQI